MSCEDGESLIGCTYTESFNTVPDVCAGTPSSWEDEENIYTQTCVDGTECTSSEALATGNLSTLTAKDAGRGGVLGGINACYEKCKKGLHACLACWALAAAAAGGPGVKPVNPPNLPKVEQTKREMVKKMLGGVTKKVAAGADAGATSK